MNDQRNSWIRTGQDRTGLVNEKGRGLFRFVSCSFYSILCTQADADAGMI